MRVLLDANVLISCLLAPAASRTNVGVVEACLEPGITLLWPPELAEEVRASIAKSGYLRARIMPEELDAFLEALATVAETLPGLPPVEALSRDPKDDCLVAHGLVHGADYLVTGDSDLLVLARVQALRIVSPARFYALIPRSHG